MHVHTALVLFHNTASMLKGYAVSSQLVHILLSFNRSSNPLCLTVLESTDDTKGRPGPQQHKAASGNRFYNAHLHMADRTLGCKAF